MGEGTATLLWLRRDLRLSDHTALGAAIARGGPVIPVFILDDLAEMLGAAPKWRLGLSLEDMSRRLEAMGSRLILRRGDATQTLRALATETGAGAVYWSRAYDPESVARDKAVKAALKQDGLDARSYEGHLMFEPWTVETGAGGFYRVYTPFWRTVKERDVPEPEPAPSHIPAPKDWPLSDALEDWRLAAAMDRGAAICRPYQRVGEEAAQGRLGWFTGHAIGAYDTARDLPAEDGTSGLSENLALGEISPRRCWHAGMRAMHEGKPGAETWLKELVWREFAYHLAWHTPRIVNRNWREDWDAFPWNEDEDHPQVIAWKQGRTGIPFVDAAMREMYVTGRMHNRARMIVASYLTKHLLSHWRIGQKWFEACLTDWDPASNAMGWQWSAGSGPDATPYFRVFNPETQVQKFDPKSRYLDRWIAEGRRNPTDTALSYFEAIPRKWGLSADDIYPEPIVSVKDGRAKALAAYERRGF
ncbi:deoxyribodipyrimidine photolyase, putative [Roseobacter sp. AzwK-3b]|uniref:cryptochrome/photolyase family protein n=1 Tax=Roseobacter sp. AzwK-3b TaxID=351016 RepID=UPI0001568D6F|nr:deoxyribodipyrimidine photo-lyase [Roseobacter sp. AzwK-3b]EDM71461.1 deoxyribodipyrimidine photolyase, putative [Roseobacter sp. AzwK-3b]